MAIEIEIKKVEKVIKNNQRKFDEIVKREGMGEMYLVNKYCDLYKLFHCFVGDLYTLFGDECIKKLEEENNDR